MQDTSLKVLDESGYKVNYARCPILGFNFAVDSLYDLGDGVRLARIAEIIAGDHSFQFTQSVPLTRPVSLVQRQINMRYALPALRRAGVALSESTRDPKELAKGEREVIMQVIWEVLVSSEFPVLIDIDTLRKEITNISPNAPVFPTERTSQAQELKSTLLLWCQTVCAKYMEVRDFTTSFDDGKALCYIFHHYHPELVPLVKIKKTTRDYFPGYSKVCEANTHFNF